MQSQKNTRRKRKDHESRDFTCRCGKSYLSYAAAYTHVKNKHNLQRQFLEDIGKPQRQKLPRGRPKEKNQLHSSLQIQQLSIIQEAILKIYQILHEKFDKIILQGNNKQKYGEIETIYKQLIQKNEKLHTKINDTQIRFLGDLNKHFSAQISGRIKLVVGTISKSLERQVSLDQQQQNKIILLLNQYDIWKGQNEINSIIYQAFIKWLKIQS